MVSSSAFVKNVSVIRMLQKFRLCETDMIIRWIYLFSPYPYNPVFLVLHPKILLLLLDSAACLIGIENSL